VRLLFPTPCAAAGLPDRILCQKCEVRQLAICAALEDEDLHRLDAIVTHIQLDAGETLFYETDEAGHLFTVATGTLRLHKMLPDGRRQITGFVLPGDFLGLSGRDGFSYSAEAVTEAGICRFPRRELEALFDEFPRLEKEILWKARDELIAAQEQMLLLGRKMPAEKIASFLLGLSRRAERWEMPSDPVLLPMSRGDIADYLGLTVETVSRTFTRLKSEGVIELPEAHRVVLSDRERLEELAEGS
jgi:CRP/FNR family transcriptional regulator